ncbi:hypothetical protein ACOME3_000228 [Neoechinorhynchus agilis]
MSRPLRLLPRAQRCFCLCDVAAFGPVHYVAKRVHYSIVVYLMLAAFGLVQYFVKREHVDVVVYLTFATQCLVHYVFQRAHNAVFVSVTLRRSVLFTTSLSVRTTRLLFI